MILWRSETGKASLTTHKCPHLGADLVKGRIDGDHLRCPFHGFKFGTDGECKDAYGQYDNPAALRLNCWQVRECSGFIFTYYDPDGRAPQWSPPHDSRDLELPKKVKYYNLRSTPIEVGENSVDFGHFGPVHDFKHFRLLQPVKTNAHKLVCNFTLSRSSKIPLAIFNIGADLKIMQHGLGCSLVESRIHKFGLVLKHFILCAPTEHGRLNLWIALNIQNMEEIKRKYPVLKLIPFADKIALELFFYFFREDFDKDVAIWDNKDFVAPPVLRKGDGPIALFRRWVNQFY